VRGAGRHVDVDNVEIERVTGVDRFERGIGICHKDDRVTILLEMKLDQPPHCFLVIDDENSLGQGPPPPVPTCRRCRRTNEDTKTALRLKLLHGAMVENGWKLHLDPELDFVDKSDELLVLMLGDNLKDAMLCLAAYAATVGVAVVTLARFL
jgi:hypothetical protein